MSGRRKSIFAVSWLVCVLFSATYIQAEDSQAKETAQATETIIVHDAVVRLMPPGVNRTAMYMVIENQGQEDQEIIGVSIDWAADTELHDHIHEGGQAMMREIEKLVVPAGQQLVLAPGGKHVMVYEVTQPLEEGQRLPIRIESDQGAYDAEARVQKNVQLKVTGESHTMKKVEKEHAHDHHH